MTRRRATGAALLVACIWLLTGCGDDDDDASAESVPQAEVRGDTAVVDTTPVSSTTTSTTVAGSTYVIQAGDTLGAIAARFGVSIDAIAAANGITDPDSIQVNQELTIPPATPATTVAATTDTSTAADPATTSTTAGG